MTEQETAKHFYTFAYVIFFSLLIFVAAFRVYMNHRNNQLKALEKIYKALEALGTLEAKLWSYNGNPTPENKEQFNSDIIAPASMYLPWTDVEFLHDLDRKSDEEIKEYSEHIHDEIMKLVEIRDKLHVKIYGRAFP
ncbi:hypothetical protein [Paenibacillus taichungensis]